MARCDMAVTARWSRTRWNDATRATIGHAGTGAPCRPGRPACRRRLPARIGADRRPGERRRRPARRRRSQPRLVERARRRSGGERRCPVLVGDVAKGAAGAAIGRLVAQPGEWWLPVVGGGAAMVGHAWPLFAGFRGGRSVATFGGAAAVISPVDGGRVDRRWRRRRAGDRIRSPRHPGRLRRLPASSSSPSTGPGGRPRRAR